ncbi:MAG: hypothetical protein H8E40_14235 [Chloroflexi bacterium]|nr:hypothetical protein [Chloroflexota bacterium]
MKIRFGVRAKILIFFLALSFISLGVISSLAFRTIYQVSYIATQSSAIMAEEVARKSIASLEDLGRRLIQRRAPDIANQIEIFIRYPLSLSTSAFMGG